MPMHAIQHLRNCDPRLAEWIDRLGVLQFPTPQAREPYVRCSRPSLISNWREQRRARFGHAYWAYSKTEFPAPGG